MSFLIFFFEFQYLEILIILNTLSTDEVAIDSASSSISDTESQGSSSWYLNYKITNVWYWNKLITDFVADALFFDFQTKFDSRNKISTLTSQSLNRLACWLDKFATKFTQFLKHVGIILCTGSKVLVFFRFKGVPVGRLQFTLMNINHFYGYVM